MPYMVTLYKVSKKINSTAQPAGPGLQTICKLKDGSGILNPTIVLDFTQEQNWEPQDFNMAYIPEFSRYYWITNIRYITGLWEFTLMVDPLASHKTAIGNTNAYIYRADTGYSFSDFIDNKYPYTTYEETVNAYPDQNPFISQLDMGTYVLGISGQNAGTGGVSYIAMTPTAFNQLAGTLFDPTANWLDINEIEIALQKALVNPMQYIQSVQWFPFDYTSIPGQPVYQIQFGWWNLTIQGGMKMLGTTSYIANTFNIMLPRHPAYAQYGREMNMAPATRYTCIFLPFGEFEIDPMDVISSDRVVFSYVCDLITGQAFCLLGSYEYDGDQYHTKWFDSRQAKIGVTIAINQTTQDVMGAGTAVIGGVAGLATGSAVAVKALAAIGAVTSTADRIAPKSTTSGGQGNTAFYNVLPRIIGQFLSPSQRDHTQYGTPVFAPHTINTFSGFVQCNGVFAGNCTQEEIDNINEFMENGFFFE